MIARISSEENVLRDPVALLLENDHYSTIDPSTPGADQWKKARPKGSFPRGSGKSTCSWLKPGSVVAADSAVHTPCRKTKKSSNDDAKSDVTWCQSGRVLSACSVKKQTFVEDDVWTCPHCKIVLRGTPSRLTVMRNNHIANRHPGMRGKSTWRRKTVKPVIATQQLPASEVAWTCPFCKDALPALSKFQNEKSVKHHYATKHKRRNTSHKSILNARSKLYQKDKNSQPALQAGKSALVKKQWLNAESRAKARDEKTGHCTTYVRPDWLRWAGKASSNKKSARLRVCTRCWCWHGRTLRKPCPGSPPRPAAAAKSWWKKLREGTNPNVQILVTAWNTT